MLSGLIDAGFAITGTWPIRTERSGRVRDLGSNALASSIVLVCRPRPADAPLTTRREFRTALRRELPDALRKLQQGNIAPVDLAQASIGPGMAVFSRYRKVQEVNGERMGIRTALQIINQVLDEVLAEEDGEFDADTRWALAWHAQYGLKEAPYGMAETLSKAKNTSIRGLVEAGIVTGRSGIVRLRRRDELEDWAPEEGDRLSSWFITQQLIRALEVQGEGGAGQLLHLIGDAADRARDLAYRLYVASERRGDAQEALAYNSLVVAWPDVVRLAASAAEAGTLPLFRH